VHQGCTINIYFQLVHPGALIDAKNVAIIPLILAELLPVFMAIYSGCLTFGAEPVLKIGRHSTY